MTDKFIPIMSAIETARKDKFQTPKSHWGKSMQITCPICSNKLNVAWASSNGHVRAECRTCDFMMMA